MSDTTSNPIDTFNWLFDKVNGIRVNIDNISLELSKLSFAVESQVNPDYQSIARPLIEFQQTLLNQLIAKFDQMVVLSNDFNQSIQITSEQKITVDAVVAEINNLHALLVSSIDALNAKYGALYDSYTRNLSIAVEKQAIVNNYIEYLRNIRGLYASTTSVATRVNPVSRYNDSYFCEILNHYVSENTVKIEFNVHGDMSFGPLQNALSSRLLCRNIVSPVVDHYFEINDQDRNIKGVLVFRFPEPILATDPLSFMYGEFGYSYASL